jgi:tetratricopeptide (TPR) repeat protein
MSIPHPNQPSASPNRSGDPVGKTDVEPPFEEQLRAMWDKKENRTTVFVGCAVVVLVILGWYGYKALATARENQIEAAYSAAAVPARLRAFAQEYKGHPLAGVAYLKLADDAYAAGNYAAAIDDYERAAAPLPGAPFVARALLGKAMCQIRSGKTTEGTAGLHQMAEDAAQLKALRCEAAYHLASLAFEAGNFSDVTKFSDLIMQVDAGGVWAQRSMQLRLQVPVTSAPGPAVSAPGQATPAIPAKLPGS